MIFFSSMDSMGPPNPFFIEARLGWKLTCKVFNSTVAVFAKLVLQI